MVKSYFTLGIFSALLLSNSFAKETLDYRHYHEQVLKAEQLIANENFQEALEVYDTLLENYRFVFLREYQIATQLALYLNDIEKSKRYLKRGMSAGWKMKSIKRNNLLKILRKREDWSSMKVAYKELHASYQSSINIDLRAQAKKMFSKDQRKAFGALFRFSSDAQDRYAEKKFAPHSEQQMQLLLEILATKGYPGEKLVGNDYWISTIISHHNSISTKYVKQDTIYSMLKPQLREALKIGQISPYELALIDDWYYATLKDESNSYGILRSVSKSKLFMINQKRHSVLLRKVETRNKLIEVQKKTGLEFYLPSGWNNGKIESIP